MSTIRRKNITLYHAVFSPKWRREWLVGDVAAACEGLIHHICALKGLKVEALAIMPDHVHLLFSTQNSTFGIARHMHNIKWFTSLYLRKRFKHLAPHKAFWAARYFSRSVQTPGLKGKLDAKADKQRVLNYIRDQFMN